jgi:hypothetical protein
MTMAKHSDGCGYPKRLALLGALFLPFGAVAVVIGAAVAAAAEPAAARADHPSVGDKN